MAFIDLTLVNDFKAKEATNEKFDANYGMLNAAKDSTPFTDYVPPSVRELFKTISASRLANIPVLKDQSVTVTTVPGFANIPLNMGETANYYFSAYDIFSGFRLYPAAHENNQVDAEWYAKETMKNVMKGMAVYADNIIGSVLNSRKTQVLNYTDQASLGGGVFQFDEDNDVLMIDKAAQLEALWTRLNALMVANQIGGNYRAVSSPGGFIANEVEAAKYRTAQEKQLLWSQSDMPMDRRYISDQLSSSENFDGYFLRDGSIGVFENYPFDFRQGTEIGGKKWSIADMEMPYLKMRPSIYINSEATDATSLVKAGDNSALRDTNLLMTTFEEIAFWARFYVVYRYNSDLTSRQNDIIKIRGLKDNLGGN